MFRARRLARIVAVVLSIVIAFQVALVAGAPWGAWTQGGQSQGALPVGGRIVAALSTAILTSFVLAILAITDQGPWRRIARSRMRTVSYVAAGYSAIGVVMNAVSRSSAERTVWTPVTLLCCVLMVQVLRLTRD